MEPFLANHVLPTLRAPEGYRRARACWLLGRLADATFTDQNVFHQVVEEVRKAIFEDQELPVRAFAALCLAEFLRAQEKEIHDLLSPHLRELILQLLKLLRETEFDDLTQVIERLMISYEKEIVPVAAEVTQNLCLTFMSLVQGVENGGSTEAANERGDTEELMEYRSVVATSVLDNVESMLQIAEEQEGLMNELEPIVIQQIQTIFEREMSMFYEEAFSLLFSLTSSRISPHSWLIFDKLYAVFQNDASDCFSEMMPCLHNYITVDRAAFISDTKHLDVITAMCSQVMQSTDEEETVQTHAAKLMEVLLLDFRGQINDYAPKLIELAFTRLTQKITSSDLRTMCLQVVIAGMLYSPADVLHTLANHEWPGSAVPALNEFLKSWIQATEEFLGLHDRRLSVLGVCLLLSLPADQRPPALQPICGQFLPMLLHLFGGLKRAYALKAQNQAENDEESGEEDSDEDVEGKALGSDEDEVDEEGASYLEMIEEDDDNSDDDEDDDTDADEETALEAFETELDKSECDMDEYVTFYRVMTELEQNDPAWYNQLIQNLSEEQQSELKGVVGTAVKCIQQKESKMIEQAGGYTFTQTIPSSFNFGANSHPPQSQ
ncbi:unnamed protein product [Calicophoron daubneyi]|uniref:Importin-7/11-like TPR repeats domain-containing protein n=1 Tax=Calicophoron daubneyi TaxID=300641 RepID=A0AAV2SWY7_CALDB